MVRVAKQRNQILFCAGKIMDQSTSSIEEPVCVTQKKLDCSAMFRYCSLEDFGGV